MRAGAADEADARLDYHLFYEYDAAGPDHPLVRIDQTWSPPLRCTGPVRDRGRGGAMQTPRWTMVTAALP
ncbi:hypothetical protein ACLB1E_29630 [Escherichia coli]